MHVLLFGYVIEKYGNGLEYIYFISNVKLYYIIIVKENITNKAIY